MKWHLVTMDDYVDGPFSKVATAKREAELRTMDPRKHPKWIRSPKGSYRWVVYKGYSSERVPGFNVVSDAELVNWPSAYEQYTSK